MKFADMLTADPAKLSAHYRDCRALAYNNGRIAQHTAPKSRGRRRLANSMGYLMGQIEMCERAADRRGIRL
jgi:hypothetical protein